MTALTPTGFLRIGASDLEYRMIGPAPDEAPTIVMLHEGLGSVGLWGDFPDRLQAATGACVFVYSRSGYGASTPVELLSTMITPQNPAVLIRDFKTDKTFIITRSDVMRVL